MLITRPLNDTRSLDAQSRQLLRAAIVARTGRRVELYIGNEGVARTLALFAHAAGVVSYHGAGLVNALFTPQAVCVREITTRTPPPTAMPGAPLFSTALVPRCGARSPVRAAASLHRTHAPGAQAWVSKVTRHASAPMRT